MTTMEGYWERFSARPTAAHDGDGAGDAGPVGLP
jgi:hypothetical protein